MARDAAGNLVPDGTAPGARVLSQQETVGLGPDQRPINGYRVNFMSPMGQPGYVFVPMALYNPANVKAMVIAHANELDEVAKLTF